MPNEQKLTIGYAYSPIDVLISTDNYVSDVFISTENQNPTKMVTVQILITSSFMK